VATPVSFSLLTRPFWAYRLVNTVLIVLCGKEARHAKRNDSIVGNMRSHSRRTRLPRFPIRPPYLPSGRRTERTCGIGLAILALSLRFAAPAAAQQSVWEFTPYRIQVFVGFENSAELSPQVQEDLISAFQDRSNAVVGAVWDLTVTRAPLALHRTLMTDLETVTVEQIPPKSLEGDKVLLMTVTSTVAGYQVTARELDVHTQSWNTIVRRTIWQSAKLADGLFRAAREAFAPLAQITELEKKKATLQLRAAALPTRDKSFRLVNQGDLFQPLYRYNDREGKPRRITTIPFTYLRVENITQGEAHCQLHSGIRSPLSSRRRGRVKQLALGIVPPQSSTSVTLHARGDVKQILPGYDIYQSADGTAPAQWIGRTDWRGELPIPPSDSPLRILLVRSGGELLARVPIVPGLQAKLSVPVPDNTQKLHAESFLKGFQEDLIDLVTRREVFLAQARSHLQAQRLEEAQQLLEKLRLLKTRVELTRQLDQALKKLAASDPLGQRNLEPLFAETRKLLDEHLNPADLERLATAIRDGRAANVATEK